MGDSAFQDDPQVEFLANSGFKPDAGRQQIKLSPITNE